MRHFFTNRVRVVLLSAVLIAVVLAVLGSLTGFDFPQKVVQGALSPFRAGASKVVDGSRQVYDYIFQYESLQAENEELKAQLAQIQDDARDAYATQRENERLRAILELKESHEDYELVDAYIITTSSADWSNTITINRGTNAGLEKDMCAITAYGEVVGIISEVGHNYAVIKTVLDSSLEISATVAVSGYSGMVQGGYATGQADRLRMNYLPTEANIHNGSQVITAGSTVYPRNLILGYVESSGFDDTGVARYATLKPAADIRSLEQVFIVTKYDI